MTENADVSSETPPETEPSAASVARDQLLYAIGREAEIVSKDQAGNASATLVELARAYATVVEKHPRLHITSIDMIFKSGWSPSSAFTLWAEPV